MESSSMSVPAKRKLSQDIRVDAQRAYIARTAPHLLENGIGSSPPSPTSASASTTPPSAASPSPTATPGPLHYYDDDGRERSSSRGPRLSTPPTSEKQQQQQQQQQLKSHHLVPKRYRGPQPRVGDAEDIAPPPTLVSVPGSLSLCDTINYPLNRNSWRYVAAGPCSASLPHTVYRTLETWPKSIHWSWTDRSPYTHISHDASTVSSDRGFRSARTNIPVREGAWYVEIHILEPESAAAPENNHSLNGHTDHREDDGSTTRHHSSNTAQSGVSVGSSTMGTGTAPRRPMSDGPHVRLGWGRREAPLNAPVGFDGYSYGLRDTNGDKVSFSRPLPYGSRFGSGDIVGMYISIPTSTQKASNNRDVEVDDALNPARIRRKRLPIRYKSQLYFESLEYAQSKEMETLMERSRRGDKDVVAALSAANSAAVANCLCGSTSDAARNGSTNGHGKGIKGGADQMKSSVSGAKSNVGNGADGVASSTKKRNATSKGPGGPKELGTSNGSSEKASAPHRPLPTLGPDSKIGFFINGKPQGIAFRDLFDFRPLRRTATSEKQHRSGDAGTNNGNGNTKPLSLADLDEGSGTIITSSSSLASIMKSRENVFDDGATGYFPFVSLFGGARARIVSRREDFAFCPPDDIERVLRECEHDGRQDNANGLDLEEKSIEPWRALDERYDDFLAEMWRYDVEDETRAEARYEASKEARGGKSESSESESGQSSGDNSEAEDEGGEREEEGTAGKRKRKGHANGSVSRSRGGSSGSSRKEAASARNSRSATPNVGLANGSYSAYSATSMGRQNSDSAMIAEGHGSTEDAPSPSLVTPPPAVIKQEDDDLIRAPSAPMDLVEPSTEAEAEGVSLIKNMGEVASDRPSDLMDVT